MEFLTLLDVTMNCSKLAVLRYFSTLAHFLNDTIGTHIALKDFLKRDLERNHIYLLTGNMLCSNLLEPIHFS